MLKKAGLVLVALLAALLVLAATRPDSFRVERRTVVQVPAERILPMIADFHRWAEWSPWEKLDPAMKRTFGGPAAGVGSTYAWSGNRDVGSGRMEVKTAAADKVSIQLDFIEPFEGHNTADFLLAPQGNGTEVRWVMTGPAPFVTKLMGVFISMDAMIGKDFEKGLAQLKAAAEK
ncbi:MAG: polyketide cyclase [Burkholderiales bacterium PBB5]|nr:MAG: polyketide cyclase [Burkholderiales bacterium PBB5]